MADALKREREDAVEEEMNEVSNDVQKLRTTEEDDKVSSKRWTPEQDQALRQAVDEFGQRNWKSIAERVPGRNHAQCLQRWNKVLKPGLVKGHWSFEEDSVLERLVLQGCHSWSELSNSIPGRTAKQCRERWRNHLDPSINKSPFSHEEDKIIQEAYEQYGNRWTQIAELLPGRTEDAVKMRWKALNPNQTTNAKPGRPKLMPGMTTTSKSRATPPNPDNMIATAMTPPSLRTQAPNANQQLQQLPQSLSHQHVDQQPQKPMYNYSPSNMVYHDPSVGYLPQHQQTFPTASAQYPNNVVRIGSNIVEPIVEPLHSHDNQDEVNEKDAAYLNELLRSQSNSLLSFGSTRGGLNSFSDMSPEDLLASGELDALFRAVSLANQNEECTSQSRDSGSNVRGGSLSSSFLNSLNSLEDGANLQKALASMGNEDKHIFQELIDELRASGHTEGGLSSDLLADPNRFSFSSASGKSLLNSLDFNRKGCPPVEGNQLDVDDDAIDNILDSDLMKPIRKGKRI